LSHTNKVMGNDRDTIFAMVCTPSSTRGLILGTGPSSDPLTIEHHQRHVHLACENKTLPVSYRQHLFSGGNTGSNSWHRRVPRRSHRASRRRTVNAFWFVLILTLHERRQRFSKEVQILSRQSCESLIVPQQRCDSRKVSFSFCSRQSCHCWE
jgi:hypothetical protein